MLARRGSEHQVNLSIPDPVVTVQGLDSAEGRSEAQAVIARDLRAGVLARVDLHGNVLGLHYPDTVQPEGRGWMRKLVTSLFPVIGDPSEPRWELEREAVDLVLELQGRWLGEDTGAQRRSARFELVQLRRAPGLAPGLGLEVDSQGELVHDTGLSWVVASRLEERILLRNDAPEFEIEQSFTGELALLAQSSGPASEWTETAWLPADGSAEGTLHTNRRSAPEVLGVPAELLAQAVQWASCGECPDSALEDLRQRIAELLRHDPTAIAAFVAHVQSSLDGDPSVPLILSAIALAGTDQAQACLARWIADETRSANLRDATLIATFGVERPSDALIDALRRSSRDEQADLELSSGALLALGDLARKSKGRREGLVHELLGLEESAARTERTSTWLLALGNTGAAEILGAVTRLARAPDERIRCSALTAAAGVLDTESTPILAAAALEDPSAEVREHAAYLLAKRPGVLLGTESVLQLLAKEPEPAVRIAVVNGLAHGNDVESALPILEELARSDPSLLVRERAANYAEGWRPSR